MLTMAHFLIWENEPLFLVKRDFLYFTSNINIKGEQYEKKL